MLIFLSDDGTVVVEGSGRGGLFMDSAVIPTSLKDQLGPEATDGLLQFMEQVEIHLREGVITACTERFERRLVEETSSLRVQIAQVESSIRQDMTRLGSELRQEIGALRSELRQEIGVQGNDLRQEISSLGGQLRQEIGALGSELRQEIGALGSQMASERFDLLKWAFLFWIGQVVAIGTLIGVMMRMTGRG